MEKEKNSRAKRPTEMDLDYTPHWALNLETEWPEGMEPWQVAHTNTAKRKRAQRGGGSKK